MPLPRAVKIVGILGPIIMGVVMYLVLLPYVKYMAQCVAKEIARQVRGPIITVQQLESSISMSLAVTLIVGSLITWLVMSAIFYGLLRAFKVRYPFASSLLMFGHAYLVYTIAYLIRYFMTPQEFYVKLFVECGFLKGAMQTPITPMIVDIVFGICVAPVYVGVLVSRDANVEFTRACIPALITTVIFMVLHVLGMFIHRPF